MGFKGRDSIISRIFFALFIISFCSYADEKLLIVTEDVPPYSMQGENGQIEGWATDSVRSIVNKTSYSYEIKLMPWARAYNLAKEQANTLIYPIVYLDSRKDLFHFICPITKTPVFSFYRLTARKDIEVNSLADANNYLIGAVRDD